jgi:AcrR family transcriptional regulator
LRRAPRGREAVRRALLDAASALFAARGPAEISVRAVARAAGVNHGLVHRHFGSKQALVRAVMERLAAGVDDATRREGSFDPLAAVMRASPYWRILARALLDGQSPHALQRSFPVVAGLLARARSARRKGHAPDPRVATALAVALGLGWLVFEPFLFAATGLDTRRPRLRRAARHEVVLAVRRLVVGQPPDAGSRSWPVHASRRRR